MYCVLFQATYRVSLEDKEQRGREEQTSIPSNVTVSFQPLPHPQNITVTLRNPRLNNDELSVELTVEWDQPQFEYNITNYEIKFRTDSPLREFDEFLVRAQDEDKIAPQSTALNKSLDMTVDPQSPTLLVQVCLGTRFVLYRFVGISSQGWACRILPLNFFAVVFCMSIGLVLVSFFILCYKSVFSCTYM